MLEKDMRDCVASTLQQLEVNGGKERRNDEDHEILLTNYCTCLGCTRSHQVKNSNIFINSIMVIWRK